MTQPSLFDPPDDGDPQPAIPESRTLARTSDPSTSHEAAQSILPMLADLQRWAAECVRESPGQTSRELATQYCPNDPRTINRRLGECEKLGIVRRGESRACRVTGRRAAVWWPAEANSEAA